MLKKTLAALAIAGAVSLPLQAIQAADYTIRATANSNENDEDYDGLVVFKNYVEFGVLSLAILPSTKS